MSYVVIVTGEQGVGKTKTIKKMMQNPVIQGKAATHEELIDKKQIVQYLTDDRNGDTVFLETNRYDEEDIAKMTMREQYERKAKRIVDHHNFVSTVDVSKNNKDKVCVNVYHYDTLPF